MTTSASSTLLCRRCVDVWATSLTAPAKSSMMLPESGNPGRAEESTCSSCFMGWQAVVFSGNFKVMKETKSRNCVISKMLKNSLKY